MNNLDHLIWLPDQKTLTQQKTWIKTQLKNLGKPKLNQLIKTAAQASRSAYTPYSHYKVGAAILCKSGDIYSSCNAEALTYTNTDHAESSAITQAISHPASLFSRPSLSQTLDSMAAEAASLLSMIGPQAAICSYSGSSISMPA